MSVIMKMKNVNTGLFRIIISFLAYLLLSGCQKVINIDLNEAAPHIVIEGLITDGPGPYIVAISKSGSYFNQPVLPPVSNAVVVITDNVGTIDTLTEMKSGIYMTSSTRGIPGRTYNLKVLSDNQEYTGSSTMHLHVRIDSLNLIRTQSNRINYGGNPEDNTNVEVHCYFNDPVQKNFYRIKVIRNDSTRVELYRLYDDQYTNGQETELRVARANIGDTDIIELYSLDKQTYEYYRTLDDVLNSNPVFGSTPANPNTNLSNGALGYFGACAISSQTIRITKSLFNKAK